ncbi:MAG: prepilin-type N-terminal cleavage/methylation domain-containing protein [Chloroflexi bacterium]|nr:prepilin-type N-terminal cleavage/methylation domain-containing protein [Chloroflexota bacterium]
MNISRKNRAFTLIELLVVVLILAILTAVALPLYLKSVQEAEFQACKTNMKTVANAVQAHHVRNRTVSYFSGTVDAGNTGIGSALEDLQNPPICSGDGSLYTVVALGTTGKDGFHIACGDITHIFSWENGVFLTTK